jgi:hypothetical protein
MTPRWANLSEADQSTFRAITAFLMGRLEERATIEWALRLPPNERVKRAALLDLVDGPQGSGIREPWRTAWRLINESWQTQHPTERDETRTHHLGHRVAAGDRSGVIIEEISDLVAPPAPCAGSSSNPIRVDESASSKVFRRCTPLRTSYRASGSVRGA